MKRFLLALVLVCGPVGFVKADWPQFRGPLGNGVAMGRPPTELTPGSIAWTAELPGRGLSSPILVGGRIYVTCSSGPRQERLHILCLNPTDGSVIWERQFWATGRTMAHEKTAVAASTPASDGKHIFALFSSNDLICLDLDGNLKWLRGLTRDYPNASNSLGMSSSLVVAQGVVIAMLENDSESFTAGLDVGTGTNVWKLNRPKMANWTSPLLFTSSNAPQRVLLQSGKGLAAVDPKTGRVAWEFTDGASTIPSTTASDGVLYIPSRGVTAVRPGTDGTAPTQLWQASTLRPATASPLVLGGRVYTLNDAGVLTCGDAADGKRLWQLRLKGPFSATPVAAGSHLFCVNEKGLVQVVDTAQPEGAVVSELNLGKTVLSTPAIEGNALYIRADGKLWKISRD